MIHKLSTLFYQPALGMLLIRIAIGLVFVMHGLAKLGNISATAGFLGMIGIPAPEMMVYVLIAVEIVGGLMIITGLALRFAAVATGIAMVVAALLVGFPQGGYSGAEWEILLALSSFGLALTGAGSLRLLNIFEHDKDEQPAAPASSSGMGM